MSVVDRAGRPIEDFSVGVGVPGYRDMVELLDPTAPGEFEQRDVVTGEYLIEVYQPDSLPASVTLDVKARQTTRAEVVLMPDTRPTPRYTRLQADPDAPADGSPMTVEEALMAAEGTRVTVEGLLLKRDGKGVRLCGSVLVSDPPQCDLNGPILLVTGLDVTKYPDIQHQRYPDTGDHYWKENAVLVGTIAP